MGNDLGEQIDKTCKKQPLPSFFQFYYRLYLKSKKIEGYHGK